MSAVDSGHFGTQAQLDADRKFIARVNYARQVSRLAAQEFEERRAEVIAWVQSRVRGNLEALYPLLARASVWTEGRDPKPFDDYAGRRAHAEGKPWRQVTLRYTFDNAQQFNDLGMAVYPATGDLALRGTEARKRGVPTCVSTGAAASQCVVIQPELATDLALMCGCLPSELPDVLQHWTLFRPYTGNSRIQRVDPMLWECNDPWVDLKFRVITYFSVRGLASLQKTYGGLPLPQGFRDFDRDPATARVGQEPPHGRPLWPCS